MSSTDPIVGVSGVGVVGRRVVRLLAAHHRVVAYGPHDVDVRMAGAPTHRVVALADITDLAVADLVVLCGPGPDAAVTEELVRAGVPVVTVADGPGDVAELLELDALAREHDVSVVVGAAMSPGLSGLLARNLASQLAVVDEIHVAIHGTAGPSCAREHHRALAGRVRRWHDGDWQVLPAGSGRELCWFPEPTGPRDCYRADLADPLVLHHCFPDVERVSARLSATRRDRLTAPLPMLSPPHREGGIGALRVEVRGALSDGARETLVVGVAELVGTVAAAVAVTFARFALAGRAPSGVVVAGDARLPTLELLAGVAELGIRLQEFTGTPQATRASRVARSTQSLR
jgi:hypothetical protein